MNKPTLLQLDPAEAWQPWKPEGNDGWNLKWAAHLYRRAGFGAPAYGKDIATWDRVQQAVKQGFDVTLKQVLDGETGQADFDVMMDQIAPGMTTPGSRFQFGNDDGPGHELQAWWLYRCVFTPHPLREKMTLFWHNHFATSIAKVKRPGL